jgi:phenylpyruvate tautomerase PptA (4-oxalocrotonate tautomerase family)
MPVYTRITTTETVEDTKAAVAAEITTIHSVELPASNVFTDSCPSQPLLITGVIRAGRADADKVRLARDISSSSSRIAGIPEARIRVRTSPTARRGSWSRVAGSCPSLVPRTTGSKKQLGHEDEKGTVSVTNDHPRHRYRRGPSRSPPTSTKLLSSASVIGIQGLNAGSSSGRAR